jgi:hypothetical protein
MGHTLTYHSCQPVDAEREAAIRKAVDTFNVGRDWILHLLKEPATGKLIGTMELKSELDSGRASAGKQRWPGPYEAKCMVDALCDISRDCQVDWEIRATYAARPVGTIRGGVCQSDQEAHEEAMSAWRARLDSSNGT